MKGKYTNIIPLTNSILLKEWDEAWAVAKIRSGNEDMPRIGRPSREWEKYNHDTLCEHPSCYCAEIFPMKKAPVFLEVLKWKNWLPPQIKKSESNYAELVTHASHAVVFSLATGVAVLWRYKRPMLKLPMNPPMVHSQLFCWKNSECKVC